MKLNHNFILHLSRNSRQLSEHYTSKMLQHNKQQQDHELNDPSNLTQPFFPSKKRPLLSGILIFILLASLVGTLVYQRFLIKKENKKHETLKVVEGAKEKLQELLLQSTSATKTLSFFIREDGTVKDYDLVASQIIAANQNIDALELVPGGVIKYIYPVKGNDRALGYDILNDPLRNKEAYKAIRKKELFFAGPLTLIQGGVGVVGRLPVFRNDKFWGFSAVIIKMSNLLKAAGIDTAHAGNYYFQLSKINPETKKEEFFISHTPGIKYSDFVSVDLPDGEWTLSAMPMDHNNVSMDIVLLAVLGFLFSFLGGWIVFIVVKRPDKLNALVKVRTAELEKSEEKYRSLIEQASDGIIVYSFDGTIHQFNKRAYTESGYSRAEFAKLNLKDLMLERKIGMVQSNTDALQSGKTAMLERKLIKKDGTLMDIEINVSMMPDSNLLAFVRNITDRKITEKALKESEQKFSRIFQSNLLAWPSMMI
ncbi:MAG: PAS domain S-box protein [Ferruginibacter sp.]